MGAVALFDGSFLIHRILHTPATDPLPGLLLTVRSVCVRFNCKRAVFVWESGRSKTKLAEYSLYKASRKPPDEEYRSKFLAVLDGAKNFLPDIKVPCIGIPGWESDEIIGYLVKEFGGSDDNECVVISEDKDFFQLVGGRSSVYLPIKDIHVTKNNFLEYSGGIPEDQWLFYRSVVGDPSDNIAGPPGVGPVTIGGLLKDYMKPLRTPEQIDDFLNSKELVESKLKKVKTLRESRDIILRNMSLMDIRGFLVRHETLLNNEVAPVVADHMMRVCFRKSIDMTRVAENYITSGLERANRSNLAYMVTPFLAF